MNILNGRGFAQTDDIIKRRVMTAQGLRDYQEKMISDIHSAWLHGSRHVCSVMPCGAGKSLTAAEIARRTTAKGNRVLFLVHRQELCSQIFSTFISYGVDMMLCEVGMVQTISRRTGMMLPPALIITDEAHHCLASSYRKIYKSFPSAYCVGFTATPIRLNGGGLGEVCDSLVTGPTVKELIARNCLSPFDYYAPPVADLSGLRSRAGDFSAEDIEKVLNKPTIYGDVVSYYRKLADGKQAVCYCAGINSSKAMAHTFTDNGISAAHIDGGTPERERADTIEKFRRGEIKILCNVDLISEGFDVPDCAAAILLRPTKSLTLYIQQSMRCMRYKAGKRAVIIDHVGNVHRFGLPDQEFEWSLEPRPQGKKKEKTDEDFKIRQCPECFCTHIIAPCCPNCGHVYPAQERTVAEKKEARLALITETVRHYKNPSECRTREELSAYGKLKGYKPGWVYYAAKELKI
jgi:superfamily II DNA or RNA helicase